MTRKPSSKKTLRDSTAADKSMGAGADATSPGALSIANLTQYDVSRSNIFSNQHNISIIESTGSLSSPKILDTTILLGMAGNIGIVNANASSSDTSTSGPYYKQAKDLSNTSLSMEQDIPTSTPIKQVKAIEDYDPAIADEIELRVGDILVVLQEFDDGWAIGRNNVTGAQGVFPMSITEPMGLNPETDGKSAKTRSALGTRTLSLMMPRKKE
eukprot:jgi/Hompol1/5315/HPOL_004328-RA